MPLIIVYTYEISHCFFFCHEGYVNTDFFHFYNDFYYFINKTPRPSQAEELSNLVINTKLRI